MSDLTTSTRPDLVVGFRSMASQIRFWVVAPRDDAERRAEAARAVVERVASTCTRFDPTSDLMRANDAGRRWAEVSVECYDAIAAAHDAYVITEGLFDPRVLRVLTSYGYDVTLPFETRHITLPGTAADVPRRRGPRVRTWRPRFDGARRAVKVGGEPVDLGGIGKGLAVRWAGQELAAAGAATLIEAGGDVLALGGGPDGDGWMIGVENPCGGSDPVAVLRLTDRAAATSSTRVRTWTVGDEQVHHLIDPRTRRPAAAQLRAVTVVGTDPAMAEVWSKSLFVIGRRDIRAEADERGIAALWVDDDGHVGVSRAMRPYVAWQVSRAA